VAPVVVCNDFINIGLARNSDVVASLENVNTVEFANDAELVKRDDKVVPDVLDGVETKGFVPGRNGKVIKVAKEENQFIVDTFEVEAALMNGGGEADLFHKDIIDKLFPEAWGFWVALESVVDGEDMTVGNWSKAFSFDPPFSELVVNGHIERILGGGASAKALPASAPRAIMHSAATRAQNKRLEGSTQVAYVSAKVTAWPYRFPPLHVPQALGFASFSLYAQTQGRTFAPYGRGMGLPNMF
jgi:hypothetical protein